MANGRSNFEHGPVSAVDIVDDRLGAKVYRDANESIFWRLSVWLDIGSVLDSVSDRVGLCGCCR